MASNAQSPCGRIPARTCGPQGERSVGGAGAPAHETECGEGPTQVGDLDDRRPVDGASRETFEEQIGYARAVVDGDWVHVSGTTGFDYTTMTIPDGVVEQAEQCLRTIEAALNPTPGPWIYFVATNPSTGETGFAVTEQQFQQLKAKYDAWQRTHPGQ